MCLRSHHLVGTRQHFEHTEPVIDVELGQRAQHIHANQQRRLIIEAPGLEHPKASEGHFEVGDRDSADVDERHALLAPALQRLGRIDDMRWARELLLGGAVRDKIAATREFYRASPS